MTLKYNKSGPMPSLKVEIVYENLLKNDIEGVGYVDLEPAIRK